MLLVSILVLSAVTVVSAAETGEDLAFTGAENTVTKINYTDNTSKTYQGALDPQSVEPSGIAERISSYEIYCNDEKVFEVTLNDIHSAGGSELAADGTRMINGYYAVAFELPGQNKEAFVTGLNPSNLTKLQNSVVNSYVFGEFLRMEDIGFIDTEKTPKVTDDLELCWAASCSNILSYTGWGKQAGFNDCDDIFEYFIDSFTNQTFDMMSGIQWFFNGIAPGMGTTTAQARDYGKSGWFFPNVSAEDVTERYQVSDGAADTLKNLTRCLKEGYGVALGVKWGYKTGLLYGGHAISCWGYVVNNDYSEDELEHYDALFVSDSDSDMDEFVYENRRMAPNIINVASLTPYSDPVQNYDGVVFNNYRDAALDVFVALKPYEEGKYVETDPDAKLDKFNYPDLICNAPALSTGSFASTESVVFPCGSDICVFARFSNQSDKRFTDELKCYATVTDSNGDTVASGSWAEKKDIYNYLDYVSGGCYKFTGLPEGKYTATVTLNREHDPDEAFYTNNTNSIDFEIRDLGTDISGWSIEADFGRIERNGDFAALSYPGITQEILDSALYAKVELSYFDNGEWSYPEYIGMLDDGKLPDSCWLMGRMGNKVRFNLTLGFPDMDDILITSEEYDVNYDDIIITPSDSCADGFTNLEHGASGFIEGEKAAFTLTNISAENAFEGEVRVELVSGRTEKKVGIATIPVKLSAGETSEEYSFDKWSEDPDLQGMFDVNITARGVIGEYDDVDSSVCLGTVKIKETPSCYVNSQMDLVDEYDGFTSLSEAVAFCPDGGTVTFDPKIRSLYAEARKLFVNVLTIDKNITIDAGYRGAKDNIFGVELEGFCFDVKPGASLKLRGLLMDNKGYPARDYGSAVISSGGLEIEDCMFKNSTANLFGGAVYCGGGTAKLINTTFVDNKALDGGSLAVNGGAKVDMLNCSVMGGSSRSGAVQNIYGELNIVNSDIMNGDTVEGYQNYGGAVTSNRVTRLVNCLLYNSADGVSAFAVSGETELYGCAYSVIDPSVSPDGQCLACGSYNDIVDLSEPYIFACGYDKDEYNPHAVVNVKDGYRSMGYSVSVEDGLLSYSDGENTYKTTVPAAFDRDAYSYDMFGTQRNEAFGCCVDKSKIVRPVVKGDVNLDGVVDILDAALIQKYAVDKTTLSEEQLAAADVNSDNVVDSFDATLIMKFAAGKIMDFDQYL